MADGNNRALAQVVDLGARLANLRVTETAVKHHLGNMYTKFGIPEGGERRRVLLANEAFRRGAVVISEMISADPR